MPGGGGAFEEEQAEGAGACRGRFLLLATSPIDNLEALRVPVLRDNVGLRVRWRDFTEMCHRKAIFTPNYTMSGKKIRIS